MPREKFENRTVEGEINVACKTQGQPTKYWVADKLETCKRIISIVNQYQKEGFPLTLRQLHYQLVKNNWIVNHDTAYKKLGGILDDLRYSGLVDWDMFVDRGRKPYMQYSVDDIVHALQDTVDQYKLDRQRGQKNVVEVWSEKDALSDILRRPAEKYHCRLVINKGYGSSSAFHVAYKRVLEAILSGKTFTILYFGDHDPSGLDMVRDIRDRLMFFLTKGYALQRSEQLKEWWDKSRNDVYAVAEWANDRSIYRVMTEDNEKIEEKYRAAVVGMFIEENELFKVVPMGLTMEQIKKYELPENPTKMTDTRAAEYIRKFGRTCWEVDGLAPRTLISIVEAHIKKEIDIKLYNSVVAEESEEREQLVTEVEKYKNL